ncbi:MAG: dienelactone hydrolase [Alphaproteobacteria bacterium 40-19]|nr:MAG: dienelactone hydrolase [Alphaproteobacteria bacterium 40-19]
MQKNYEYSDGKTLFQGYLSVPQDQTIRRPYVMVAHAWDGPSDYFNSLADDFSQKGFIGFAIDVYGKGKRGKIDGDNSHLMNPLLEDRALLRKRLLAAFTEVQQHPLVVKDKIVIVGYCFGGLCALDLARANPVGLKGAISVHGGLTPPQDSDLQPKIDASILVLHGWEDPVAPQQSVLDSAQEMLRPMTKAKADWQIHCCGNAKHAFNFVGADMPEFGVKYDQKAHQRSITYTSFLQEIFNEQDNILLS